MGIRSLGKENSTYNDVFGETGETGLRDSNTGPWIAASGGTTTTYTAPHPIFGTATYTSHTFTSSGSFQITGTTVMTTVNRFDFLVQAGGGGTKSNPMGPPGPGGGNRECGSGAGGLVIGTDVTAAVATHPVTIGGGGSGANGSDSTLAYSGAPQVAVGGGAGGAGDPAPTNAGNPGGSGGGGWYTTGQPNKGNGTQADTPLGTGYGNDGSPGQGSPEYGGAGGGAGGAGGFGTVIGPGTVNTYRYGGSTPQTYGAGGQASDYASTNRQAAGAANSGNGSSAIAAGGSGIVVIRYVSGG